jgi:hypothetical protein
MAVACVLLVACATARDPRPDVAMKPDGEAWFCASEASGMLSVCERTRKRCKRAKKFIARLSHRRGDQMTLRACKPQPRAFCLTAERRLPKERPEDDAAGEDEASEEADDPGGEASEDEAAAEAAEAGEADEADRYVVEDALWLCYATRDNCEQQRKNMYYAGFTNVSRCGRWK